MLLNEALSSPRLERRPEPTTEMDDMSNVIAFHDQGAATGPLLPVYHFNALATSRLVRRGGSVVDLGSGSGQYLAYLAQRRPDLRIIGFDLSKNMVAFGRHFLKEVGLSDRVELRMGDMTNISEMLGEPVDLVSSVFSLHHLPSTHHLAACLGEVRKLRDQSGAAIWIFDHARPRHARTPAIFPEVFTPDSPPEFKLDSRNSLIASWSFGELARALDAAGFQGMEHHIARWLRLYQVHSLAAASASTAAAERVAFEKERLDGVALKDFKGLRGLFPRVCLD